MNLSLYQRVLLRATELAALVPASSSRASVPPGPGGTTGCKLVGAAGPTDTSGGELLNKASFSSVTQVSLAVSRSFNKIPCTYRFKAARARKKKGMFARNPKRTPAANKHAIKLNRCPSHCDTACTSVTSTGLPP
mmetsp:Transcript_45878/g.63742  ORF Transcript_45878/g.63742 Transcript_45878/m.63742 type:complete len:135 (-) Transcript_45878:976-1380(-)